ncbi:hypothetical protein [Aliidiomarina taiwanensis]|nr:hypothetical protein [Aliidiomarina taiwanensis]
MSEVFLQNLQLGARYVSMLLLFESVMWVLYYMLLRILIEKHLSIFNEAEYFIALPFVLATQLFFLASILGVSVSEVLAIAMNLNFIEYKTTGIQQLAIGTFGYIYTALIIANIINLIPAIPVGRRPNITIVGAGDVVRYRMLPALLANKLYLPSQIAIVSDGIEGDFLQQLKKDGVTFEEVKPNLNAAEKIQEVIKFIKKRSSYAVVATPTASHLGYVAALAKEGIVFGIEKPLAATASELAMFQKNGNSLMQNGFLFSYYWLEKALPLNYFFSLNPQYQRFLDITVTNASEQRTVDADALAYLRIQLGKLKSADIVFLEGKDSREWSLLKETGGLFFETLIHPVTLLNHVLEQPLHLSELEADWYLLDNLPNELNSKVRKLNDFGATYVSLRSKVGADCAIQVCVGKYMPTKTRSMKLTFEHGSLHMDLDARVCTITCPQAGALQGVTIKVCSDLSNRDKQWAGYDVQMTLFDSFVRDQGYWSALRYDDYPNQVEVLSAMIQWLKTDEGPTHFYRPKVLNRKEYNALECSAGKSE